MSFFSEVAFELGLTSPATGYQIVDYNGEAIYIEGIRRILNLTPEAIRFEARRGILECTGQGLILKRIDDASRVVPRSNSLLCVHDRTP